MNTLSYTVQLLYIYYRTYSCSIEIIASVHIPPTPDTKKPPEGGYLGFAVVDGLISANQYLIRVSIAGLTLGVFLSFQATF